MTPPTSPGSMGRGKRNGGQIGLKNIAQGPMPTHPPVHWHTAQHASGSTGAGTGVAGGQAAVGTSCP